MSLVAVSGIYHLAHKNVLKPVYLPSQLIVNTYHLSNIDAHTLVLLGLLGAEVPRNPQG